MIWNRSTKMLVFLLIFSLFFVRVLVTKKSKKTRFEPVTNTYDDYLHYIVAFKFRKI